ncbi:hypothetical protein SNE40_011606 [Patella caerulea]|uniref:C2H2-type domain-containing protein n=1 Tax=Patella caerulea TaxID=87958 RepID=A0AAN8PLV4_PATCE
MTSYLYAPSGPYTCNACSMGFSSTGLLAKHKARFCIGSGHDMVLVRNCKRCESRCHCGDNDFPETELPKTPSDVDSEVYDIQIDII